MNPRYPLSINNGQLQELISFLKDEHVSFKSIPIHVSFRFIPIRVGYRIFHPRQLGFTENLLLKIKSDKTVYVLIYLRNGVPLILNIAEHTDDIDYVSICQFANTFTPSLDYPYKPFLRALKELEKQQELFIEELGKGQFGAHLVYITDILGILLFALRARGCISRKSYIGKYCADYHIDVRELRQLVRCAEAPAPSLGNSVYIDIAREAFQLLYTSLALLKQVKS